MKQKQIKSILVAGLVLFVLLGAFLSLVVIDSNTGSRKQNPSLASVRTALVGSNNNQLRQLLIWVAGGVCNDNGQACQVDAVCPSGYAAINCAQCDTNFCDVDRTTLADIGVSSYRLAVSNHGNACHGEINANSNPTHASYRLYALCLKGSTRWNSTR